jgi:erythromycin esterase
MKRGVMLLLVSCYWVMGVRAQLSNYVKKETAEIRSVQLNDTDWTDLAAFAAAVKDKRVVMLGEQTHGDGTTFALKARLVRFLHEQIGFNVLAFESDFISLAGNEKQRDSADAALFLSKNVFGIWTACNTVKPFFNTYLPKQINLKVCGFDSQLHGDVMEHASKDSVLRLWEKAAGIELVMQERQFAARWMDSLMSYGRKQSVDSLNALQGILSGLYQKMPQDKSFLRQSCESVLHEVVSRINYSMGKQNHYERDAQMARNLQWLANEKYPNEKIIVWAHSAHIAKYPYRASLSEIGEKAMMGNILAADSAFRKMSYIVGVTSFSGSVSWATTEIYDMKIQSPAKESFERLVPEDMRFAFTELSSWIASGGNIDTKFNMKGSIYTQHFNVSLPWLRVFDGMLFVRNMEGCR